jgi:aminoglycoside 3-N-acetyltransferase
MSLFETLSGIAVRRLKPDQVAALRDAYRGMRTRLAPLLRSIYGTFDAADLRRHLEAQVGHQFEILMVHSSVNNMQPMYTGNPLDLLKSLVDFCGPEKTLVMPAFYFGDPKFAGMRETFSNQPRFDVRRTPSQMGLLTELFRRYKGAVQSRHPVYRVTAFGPMAHDLASGHERARTACGAGTPFDFMARHDTLILGIGKPFEVLTQVHHAEDVLGDEFPVPASVVEPLPMTLVDGKDEFPFELTGRSLSWPRNMWKLRSIMSADELREWTFHRVPLFATHAELVTHRLVEAARKGVTLYVRP